MARFEKETVRERAEGSRPVYLQSGFTVFLAGRGINAHLFVGEDRIEDTFALPYMGIVEAGSCDHRGQAPQGPVRASPSFPLVACSKLDASTDFVINPGRTACLN